MNNNLYDKEIEVKIEESEKAGTHQESNPGHPVLNCQYSATELQLLAHSKWLPGVQLYEVFQYHLCSMIVRAGSYPPVVVAQLKQTSV